MGKGLGAPRRKMAIVINKILFKLEKNLSLMLIAIVGFMHNKWRIKVRRNWRELPPKILMNLEDQAYD